MNFKLFGDTDGKHKAFSIPLSNNLEIKSWDEAVKLCADFNATLVEMASKEKVYIFIIFSPIRHSNLPFKWYLVEWTQRFFREMEMG
jgi:hypothetical protein